MIQPYPFELILSIKGMIIDILHPLYNTFITDQIFCIPSILVDHIIIVRDANDALLLYWGDYCSRILSQHIPAVSYYIHRCGGISTIISYSIQNKHIIIIIIIILYFVPIIITTSTATTSSLKKVKFTSLNGSNKVSGK